MSEPRATAPPMRPPRRWALDVAAAFGVLCVAALAGSHALGIRPLIVAGSSMEPSLPLGSLAVAIETPVERLVVGDVVSVVRDDGARVTHRLVDLDPIDAPAAASAPDTGSAAAPDTAGAAAADAADAGTPSVGGPAELTLQGDANPGPDATRPIETNVDRVVWTVPGLGAVLRWLRSPTSTFVFGALAGVGIWSAGRRRRRPTRAVLWIDDVPYQVLP